VRRKVGGNKTPCFNEIRRVSSGFFRKLEEDGAHEGKMPDMEKFVEFWGGIWEKEEGTPNMP